MITVQVTYNCELTSTEIILNGQCALLLPGSVPPRPFGTPNSASVAATPSAGVTYSGMSGNLPLGIVLDQTTEAGSGALTQTVSNHSDESRWR
jgi:hypothetical protein